MGGEYTPLTTDRFHCICCLYRYNFVTGKLPFDGENEFKLYRVISTGVYVIPSSLPPLLKDIIKGKEALNIHLLIARTIRPSISDPALLL